MMYGYTTLDLIHDDLEDALYAVKLQIEEAAYLAEQRLDEMVDKGNRRQYERMLDFNDPWRRLKLRVNSGVRTYAEQRLLWERWRPNEPGGIAFVQPGVSHHRDDISARLRELSDQHFEAMRRDRLLKLQEPWHWEYTPYVPKRKPWWRRVHGAISNRWYLFRYDRGRLK